MNKLVIFVFLATVGMLTGCATPGQENFDLASKLEAHNRFEDALPLFEDASSKEPENSEYFNALTRTRSKLAAQSLGSAKEQLNKQPVRYENLKAAQGFVEKALKYDSTNTDAASLADSIKQQMNLMLKNAEAGFVTAKKAAERNDWIQALEKLKEISAYYPNYLDLPVKISVFEKDALAYYLKEADTYKTKDDLDNLLANLRLAYKIQPENRQLGQMITDISASNTASSNIDKAEKFILEKKWEKALEFFSRAKKLKPDQNAKDHMQKLLSEGSAVIMEAALKDLQAKRVYSSYVNLMAAFNFNPDVFKSTSADDVRNQLITALLGKADELETSGYIGGSLFFSECALTVAGSSKEIFQKIQVLKDRLKQRVVKKIAIMDFNPPTNNQDAGRLVTDSLLSYMTKNASGDVKILARDVLGAIIKEIELGQAGLYDIDSAKKSGKLKGTDVFIFGSLLQYSVEKNVEEGQRTVVAKIGVDKESNPQFLVWMQQNPNPNSDQKKNAPSEFIEKDRRETFKYKVASHKKTANITISFRVIDVESGEVVITKTLKNRKDVEGTYQEGIELANIPYIKLDLPSDTELLERVVDSAIAELGQQVLSRFQNLQETYFNAAEVLKKKGDIDPVIEKYVDAYIAEEVKNIKTPVTNAARLEIDKILKKSENYPL